MSISIAIAGPTGVGKTDLAIRLAKKFINHSEIISLDSVQVYQKVNIGSNKYQPITGDPIHYLIDELSISEKNSIAKFTLKFKKVFDKIIFENKIPIIVGGSSFYFDWILNGQPCSPYIPVEIQKMAEFICDENKFLDYFFYLGYRVDSKIHRNDLYRNRKNLEMFLLCGKSLNNFHQKKPILPSNVKTYLFYLTGSRYDLYKKVDHRCEIMIRDGLVSEVAGLLSEGEISIDSNAGRSIGYLETIDFVQNFNSEETDFTSRFLAYLSRFQSHTHELIRKQETWFLNRFKEFIFFERKSLNSSTELDQIAEKIFDSLNSSEKLAILCNESDIMRESRKNSALKKSMKNYRITNTIFCNDKEIESVKNELLNFQKS
jgi:tRNA dimethylallyltransferase